MAWKDNLLDASYRGTPFAVISTRDTVERAQVQHEYPYRDGAEIEDLGRRPRKITMRAVFWGTDYEDKLKALVKKLDEKGPGELIHPVFGSMTVAANSYEIDHHEESPDYAEIQLVFTEATPDQPFFGRAVTAPGKAAAATGDLGQALGKAKVAALAALGSWAEKIPGMSSVLAASEALSGVTDALGQARDLAGLPRSILGDALAAPMALWSEAEGVANAVLDTALALPQAGLGVFGQFAAFSERLVGLPLTAGGLVEQFIATIGRFAGLTLGGPESGSPGALPVLTLPSTWVQPVRELEPLTSSTPVTAQGYAQAAALSNLARATVAATEASRVLLAEADAPTLTPSEVEAVVGVTRDRIQASIEEQAAVHPAHLAHPVAESLRDAALAVQELGRVVIHLRPPLVSRAAPAPCNMHLLAHWMYGDFSRAQELHRLNPGVRNPNFLASGQRVNCYAK